MRVQPRWPVVITALVLQTAIARAEIAGDFMSDEYSRRQEQLAEMQSLIETRDVTGAAAIVQGAYGAWRKDGDQALKEQRSRFLEELIARCFSRGVAEAETVGREWARKALAFPSDMTAAVELQLTLRAISGVIRWAPPDQKATAAVDVTARSRSARFCCHALARFEKEYDPAWTPDANRDRLVNPLFSGTDSAVQRAKYDEETTSIGMRDVQQRGLHHANKNLVPGIERHLVELYSRPPQANGELEGLLREYQVGKDMADRISGDLKVGPAKPM